MARLLVHLLSLLVGINVIGCQDNPFPNIFLTAPKITQYTESWTSNGLRYASSAMQGWRKYMEDDHDTRENLKDWGLETWSFFSLFDGHAGSRVSTYSAENMLDTIIHAGTFTYGPGDENFIKIGIYLGILELDRKIGLLPEVANGSEISGATAVVAFVSPEKIFIANCGDSQVALFNRRGVRFITQRHTPLLQKERKRIEDAGGFVWLDRVNGLLAPSRSLGDFEFKRVRYKDPTEQLVSPEPDITVLTRRFDDEMLILACDGVWDVISPKDLLDFIRYLLQITSDLEAICRAVLSACLCKGSMDNMSILLILFHDPTESAEAKSRDDRLNSELESHVREIMSKHGPKNINELNTLLSFRNITGLPPGGLCSKFDHIRGVFQHLKALYTLWEVALIGWLLNYPTPVS